MKPCYFLISILLAYPSFAEFKVCYVSSNIKHVLPRANDKPSQFGGFFAAISRFKKVNAYEGKIDFRVFQPEGNQGAILSGILWAKKNHCSVIVGLVTSRDALIAGPLLKKNNMVGFSSTATNSKLSEYFPWIYSVSTSADSYVKSFFLWVKKNGFENNISIVADSSSIYSLYFKDRTIQLLPSSRVYYLNEKKELSTEDLRSINNMRKGVLLYTPYPLASLPSLTQITSETANHVVLFGTQSWNEKHPFKNYISVIEKFRKKYIFSPWSTLPGSISYKHFEKEYVKLYDQKPGHDSTYDFDALSIVLNCAFIESKRTLSKQAMYHCLSRKFNYLGATGSYHFSGKESHAIRKEILTPFEINELSL